MCLCFKEGIQVGVLFGDCWLFQFIVVLIVFGVFFQRDVYYLEIVQVIVVFWWFVVMKFLFFGGQSVLELEEVWVIYYYFKVVFVFEVFYQVFIFDLDFNVFGIEIVDCQIEVVFVVVIYFVVEEVWGGGFQVLNQERIFQCFGVNCIQWLDWLFEICFQSDIGDGFIGGMDWVCQYQQLWCIGGV